MNSQQITTYLIKKSAAIRALIPMEKIHEIITQN